MLTFINAYVVNVFIIIGLTLSLYAISVKRLISPEFINKPSFVRDGRPHLSLTYKISIGLFIGIVSFFISLNSIPVIGIRPIDVRYLPIYFAVYYGAKTLGSIATGSLILLKTIQYLILGASPIDFINNLLLTVAILLFSIYLNNTEKRPKAAAFKFLIFVIIIRSFLFSILYYPINSPEKLLNIIVHFTIFSSVFLITSWVVNLAVSNNRSINDYRTAAIYDNLTGLYNKESFEFYLNHAYNDAFLNHHSFSLAIIDIDNFKRINDEYGHLVGDQTLQAISQLLKNNQVNDIMPRICRIGGDELAIVFKHQYDSPDTFLETIISFLQTPVIISEDIELPVTLSIGLATFIHETDEPIIMTTKQLFMLADTALYTAKQHGKNQLVHVTHSI